MSGEYYCEFCNEPMWNSLHMCKEKYDNEMAKVRKWRNDDPLPEFKLPDKEGANP